MIEVSRYLDMKPGSLRRAHCELWETGAAALMHCYQIQMELCVDRKVIKLNISHSLRGTVAVESANVLFKNMELFYGGLNPLLVTDPY